MVSMKQVQATFVRAVLLLHFLLVVWRVTEAWTDEYWMLAVAIVPFLLEGVFTVFRKDGIEWKQFSVCFFFYLCATLPGIWLLEVHKTQVFQNGNFSLVDDVTINGVEIPLRLSPNTWVLVVEEMMLYLMILGRWMMPRGEVGREQLTQLLFGFIGIASDIMELFSLFDEDSNIRQNTVLIYLILGVWSLSVLQFTLTFVTSHRPRRARGLRTSLSVRSYHLEEREHRVSVLRVELLATVLSLLMQDGPFLGVRLYTMIRYKLLTYSLLFFTCKNVLVILLLVYKIFLLLIKICCPSSRRRPQEDGDEEKELPHLHPNFDFMKVIPAPEHQSSGADLPPGDLRKRREEKDHQHIFDPDPLSLDEGDLQKAIEGPATPARTIAKGKKRGRRVSHGGPATTETGAAEDGVEEGVDNHAFVSGLQDDFGWNESLNQDDTDRNEPLAHQDDPDRNEPIAHQDDTNRNETLAHQDDPDRNETLAHQDDSGQSEESLGKKGRPAEEGKREDPPAEKGQSKKITIINFKF
ncbi:uncharacterized protein LOC143292654 [Babylonia areolata]|uniref:uncharacterized protein LOC143292654 n=1 Tax=Babylonia areolata TaxID=304850 RepID=UPI003FD630A9